MGSIFGGGSSKTTTQNTPWSGVQPYMTDVYSNAQRMYRGGGPGYYPGQTFAPMDPMQIASQQMALSALFGNSSMPNWMFPQMPGSDGSLGQGAQLPINQNPINTAPGGPSVNGYNIQQQPSFGLTPPVQNQYIPQAAPPTSGVPSGTYPGSSGGYSGNGFYTHRTGYTPQPVANWNGKTVWGPGGTTLSPDQAAAFMDAAKADEARVAQQSMQYADDVKAQNALIAQQRAAGLRA